MKKLTLSNLILKIYFKKLNVLKFIKVTFYLIPILKFKIFTTYIKKIKV